MELAVTHAELAEHHSAASAMFARPQRELAGGKRVGPSHRRVSSDAFWL